MGVHSKIKGLLVILIMGLSPIVWPLNLAYAATVFSDDFETGNFVNWDAQPVLNGVSIVQNTDVINGTWSMNATVTANGNSYALTQKDVTAERDFYASAYVNYSDLITASPATAVTIQLLNATNVLGSFGIKNDTGIQWFSEFRNNTVYNNQLNNTVPPVEDTVYCLDLYVRASSANNVLDAVITAWVNGSLTFNITNVDTDFNRLNRLMIGRGRSVANADGFVGTTILDEAFVDNSTRRQCGEIAEAPILRYLTSLFHTGISSIDVNGTSTANLTETAFNDSDIAVGVANAASGYSYLYWDNENVSHIHDITVTKTMTANSTITAFAIAVGGGVSGISMLVFAVVVGFGLIFVAVASRKR